MHFFRFLPFGNFFLHFLVAAARLEEGGGEGPVTGPDPPGAATPTPTAADP
jgi:hypothetical protein